MRLDTRALTVATGATGAIGFAICVLFVVIAPGATSAFFSYVLHIDLTSLARPLTWGSFVAGLVTITIGFAIAAGLVGSTYNTLAREQPHDAA
jgi:hypothetical protein